MHRKRINAAIALGLTLNWAAAAQAPQEKFEVAAVKINPDSKVACNPADGVGCSRPGAFGGATYSATNVPLDLLIELAYGVNQDQLAGTEHLPKDRYDISAKPASGTLSYERTKPMLQALLEERFGLKTHREKKELAGYALVIAKTGPKLHPNAGTVRPLQTYPGGLDGTPANLDNLAGMMSLLVAKPVINKTELEGNYDLKLRYAREGDTNSSLPSLFTATQEQLGLQLESQKVPQEILVIDHCERASTEN